jgi:hypothetical protein
MSGSATIFLPRASRWILIVGAVLALLGSIAAPAQAGDFYGPSRYDYGPRYDYNPYRYHRSCYSCGCSRCGCGRCQYQYSGRSGGGVYERRYSERKYVEREYVERRYASPVHRYSSYGYGWRSGYPRYRSWSPRFPWGYGGIRTQQPYGWAPSAYYEEEPPRPPAPVGYDGGPYGDAGRGWDPE